MDHTMDSTTAVSYMVLACKELNLDKEIVFGLNKAMTNTIGQKSKSEALIEATSYLSRLMHNNPKSKRYEDEFEKLWIVYPRRLGRLTAYRAFTNARKRGTSFEAIETGLTNYLNYIKENRLDTSFVKHGSTWFHARGWEDDYSQ